MSAGIGTAAGIALYVAPAYGLVNDPKRVIIALVIFMVVGALIVAPQITLEKTVARESHRSLRDDLTQLPNQVLLQDRLEQAISAAERSETSCAVLLLDIDDFRAINDAYGHACGDALLRQVATRLNSVVRASDTVARFGNDEFITLLPLSSRGDAARVARRLYAVLDPPLRVRQSAIPVRCSIGIATYPEDGTTSEMLLYQAGAAMYERRRTGRAYRLSHDL
jgi:diguanylate cyclase (GGDEF)-like protein